MQRPAELQDFWASHTGSVVPSIYCLANGPARLTVRFLQKNQSLQVDAMHLAERFEDQVAHARQNTGELGTGKTLIRLLRARKLTAASQSQPTGKYCTVIPGLYTVSSTAADSCLEGAFCRTARSPADRILSWEAPCQPSGTHWEPI